MYWDSKRKQKVKKHEHCTARPGYAWVCSIESGVEDWYVACWSDLEVVNTKKCECGAGYVKGWENFHAPWCPAWVDR